MLIGWVGLQKASAGTARNFGILATTTTVVHNQPSDGKNRRRSSFVFAKQNKIEEIRTRYWAQFLQDLTTARNGLNSARYE